MSAKDPGEEALLGVATTVKGFYRSLPISTTAHSGRILDVDHETAILGNATTML